jgi:hypothetical protein
MSKHVAFAVSIARQINSGCRRQSPEGVLSALRLAAAQQRWYTPTPLAPRDKCCQTIAYDDEVTAAIFEFGDGAVIPLHDHPGSVASVVLSGQLQFVAVDPRSGAKFGKCRENMLIGIGDSLLSTPHLGPLHAFRSVGGPASVLDVIWPSYSRERECTYFEWVTEGRGSLWDATPGNSAPLRRYAAEPPGWEPPREEPFLGEPLTQVAAVHFKHTPEKT